MQDPLRLATKANSQSSRYIDRVARAAHWRPWYLDVLLENAMNELRGPSLDHPIACYSYGYRGVRVSHRFQEIPLHTARMLRWRIHVRGIERSSTGGSRIWYTSRQAYLALRGETAGEFFVPFKSIQVPQHIRHRVDILGSSFEAASTASDSSDLSGAPLSACEYSTIERASFVLQVGGAPAFILTCPHAVPHGLKSCLRLCDRITLDPYCHSGTDPFPLSFRNVGGPDSGRRRHLWELERKSQRRAPNRLGAKKLLQFIGCDEKKKWVQRGTEVMSLDSTAVRD
ncbi:hypothetical protein R3P38DRAFT_2761760 [Favolaschia claudopus]|uniref:Uncharacterized protein n=1 Tax=Favolaschia claudopus TaxID=2862362 RepID=A0AAW0DRJ7_9AGAR